MISFTRVNDTLSIFLRGEFHTIVDAHPNFEKIWNLVRESSQAFDDLNLFEIEEDILELLDVENLICDVDENLVVENGQVFYQGEQVEGYFVSKILEFITEEYPVSHLLNGLARLQNNPSMRVRENLYEFLERGNIVWQEDGRFLAFKAVRHDFRDVHSGTLDNSPGQIVEMDRYSVDDDPNHTCSSGLHVCSYDYLNYFSGERYVVVAVDPADVVSIPNDYNFTKMRVCRYEVLEEISKDNARIYHEDYYNEEEEYEDYYNEEEEYEDRRVNTNFFATSG